MWCTTKKFWTRLIDMNGQMGEFGLEKLQGKVNNSIDDVHASLRDKVDKINFDQLNHQKG